MRLLSKALGTRDPLKVGLGYVLAGGVLLLTADWALYAAGAPGWMFRPVAATLVTAFPFVVALAWALSARPPEGVRVRQRPWDMYS
jgi:hypothetical protein